MVITMNTVILKICKISAAIVPRQYRPSEELIREAVDSKLIPAGLEGREEKKGPALPELSETDLSRHYTELVKQVHGVNCGFYPLGSCTMKYNPRIDEEMAARQRAFGEAAAAAARAEAEAAQKNGNA